MSFFTANKRNGEYGVATSWNLINAGNTASPSRGL